MDSAKFFELISQVKLAVTNLLNVFELASKEQFEFGIIWYLDAHNLAANWAEKYNLPIWKVAGILAAFSINSAWDANVSWAELFILSKFGKATPKGMGIHFDYANRIYNSKTEQDANDIFLGSVGKTYKLFSFFTNINRPTETIKHLISIGKVDITLPVVTIDRHAVAACKTDFKVKRSDTKGFNYWKYAVAYYIASRKVGLTPQQFQAVVWLVVRETILQLNRHSI